VADSAPAVLFALPCGPEEPRGNVTTARRIGRGLVARGWSTARCDARTDPAHWPTADVVVALHAVHSAPRVHAACDPAAGAPALRGRPYLVLFTGTDLNGPPSAEARAAVAEARAAVALGAAAHAQAGALYPEPRGGSRVIPQGVEPLPEGPWPAEAPPPEPATDLVLLPGGVRAVKNPLRAVRALAPLASRRRQLRLWLAGPGMEVACAAELQAEIAAVNAAAQWPWVRWLGAVPRERLRPLIETAQVVISTSRAEGGPPNALLEAAECGRPLLASDIPAHREFPGPDHLFGDDADFRARTEALLLDLPGATRIGKQLRARAMKDFSAEIEAAAWDALLRAAVARAE
jgi:glycosyltransferase involved in cell wall biosynthesis